MMNRIGIVVAAASPRQAQPLPQRTVRDGFQAAADRPQGRGVLECRPGEQGLRVRDLHRCDCSHAGGLC